MGSQLTLRRVTQVAALLCAAGFGFLLIKGAVMFALLLLTKCMMNLMAYPLAITTLSTAMTALLRYQLLIAAVVGPFVLGPYLFRTLGFVTGLTSAEHPYSASQFVSDLFQGIRGLFKSTDKPIKEAEQPSQDQAAQTTEKSEIRAVNRKRHPAPPPLLLPSEELARDLSASPDEKRRRLGTSSSNELREDTPPAPQQ